MSEQKRNILACTIYEKNYSTAYWFIRGFEKLGHSIVTCGSVPGDYEGVVKEEDLRSKWDIPLWDRKPLPIYSYNEILEKYRKKYGDEPELIIQIEPHFVFMGEKPKHIPCVFVAIDSQRALDAHLWLYQLGQFDYMFMVQKKFLLCAERIGFKNLVHLPFATDEEIFKIYPEYRNSDDKCDIAFLGNSGILFHRHDMIPDKYRPFEIFDKADKDGFRYCDKVPDWIMKQTQGQKKYHDFRNGIKDGSRRAEHLMRLMQDFNVRFYHPAYWEECAMRLNKGKIGWNCSLAEDVTFRPYQVTGCATMLITDWIRYQDEIFQEGIHCKTYDSYFPSIENVGFNYEYLALKRLVEYYLIHDEEREQIAMEGQRHVYQYHTYKHRALKILDTVFGGYI